MVRVYLSKTPVGGGGMNTDQIVIQENTMYMYTGLSI